METTATPTTSITNTSPGAFFNGPDEPYRADMSDEDYSYHCAKAHELHDLFIYNDFDGAWALMMLEKAKGHPYHRYLRHSLIFGFNEKGVINILAQLYVRYGYDACSDHGHTLTLFLAHGRLEPVLFMLALRRDDLREFAELLEKSVSSRSAVILQIRKLVDAELVRLEAKRKEGKIVYKYGFGPSLEDWGQYPDGPLSVFEWFLDEHGAPSVNYTMCMYASQADYCDVLRGDMSPIDRTDIVAWCINNIVLDD